MTDVTSTTSYGPPTGGQWSVNDTFTDAAGNVFTCVKAGFAAAYGGLAGSYAVFYAIPASMADDAVSAVKVAAGADNTDAVALAAGTNLVTGADGTKGGILPVMADDAEVIVVNTDAAGILKVYPHAGAAINALTATTGAFSIGPNKSARFSATSATQIYCPGDSAVTATVAEMNKLTGVTSTAAELNYVDVAAAGTLEASKAIVVNAAKHVDEVKTAKLSIGASGADVDMTPVVGNGTASRPAMLDANKKIRTAANVGSPAALVTAVEYGDGHVHTTVLTLASFAVGNSGDAAALAIGATLYTLPAGAVVVESSYISVGLTLADAVQTDTPEIGLGTVACASEVQATLGAVGATAENIHEGVAVADVAGTAKVNMDNPTANVPLLIAAADPHVVCLNVADTWADLTAASAITATGTVVLNWRFMA